MNEFIIDFQVTKNCNLNCEFCCGADKSKKDSTTAEIKSVIDKLEKAGVDRIVLTGGEPLIRRDIDEIIKYIYGKGIKVYLSTNGYYLKEHLDIISDCVDCVGLPLDGFTPQLSEKMTRKDSQLDTTLNALKMIKETNKNIITKVGTVVSKINYDTLEELGKLLYKNEEYEPDVWRLYQFTPLGEGKKTKDKFYIDDKEYEYTVEKIKKKFSSKNIGSLSNEESNDTYIFVAPDMEIVGLTDDDYISLGNALEMSYTDIINLRDNMEETLQNAKKNREWTIKK
jgi:MoaA/NifB/PqqE/SkfB family radical SAM enzyme